MKPETKGRGRPQYGQLDEDDLVTLQIPRKWREKLRKIAALEERSIVELTEEAVRRWVGHWEKGVGHTLSERPLSQAKGIDPEDVGLPPSASDSRK